MGATQPQRFPYLIISVSLGLVAGFLWAPRAGKEMRHKFRRAADEGLDVLTKEGKTLRGSVSRWVAGIAESFVGDITQRGEGLSNRRIDKSNPESAAP